MNDMLIVIKLADVRVIYNKCHPVEIMDIVSISHENFSIAEHIISGCINNKHLSFNIKVNTIY